MSVNVLKGISFDGVHSYKDLGLYMHEYPEIEMPEVQDYWVDVPGRDGRLNLTRALDGLTHYYNRDCEFSFLCVGDKDEAMAAYTKLGNLLHGQQISKIIFDEDSSYYWTGQLEVSAPKYKNYRSEITVKGELEPYKHELYAVGESWLWDGLDFENGTIRDKNDWTFSVSGADDWVWFYVDAGPMPVIPTITVSGTYMVSNVSSLQFRYYPAVGSYVTTYLSDGEVVIPAFVLKGSSGKFRLKGTGTIALSFRGGSL